MKNEGVIYLFTQDRLRHLKKLDLSSNWITDESAYTIAQSQSFPILRTLDLRVNKIGN